MSESLDHWRKRLLYRASYTGTKETDLLLGAFARKHVEAFDAGQLARFEALLEAGDQQIFAWATGQASVPKSRDDDIMRLLQDFKLAFE